MNSIMSKINKKSKDVIDDNRFLFAAFENRLLTRLVRIFEKRNIPINKDNVDDKCENQLNKLKIILLGNSGVGKTSILKRLANNKFDSCVTTVGCDTSIYYAKYKSKKYQ